MEIQISDSAYIASVFFDHVNKNLIDVLKLIKIC